MDPYADQLIEECLDRAIGLLRERPQGASDCQRAIGFTLVAMVVALTELVNSRSEVKNPAMEGIKRRIIQAVESDGGMAER